MTLTHLNFPHVHILGAEGDETVISLIDLEICEGTDIRGKTKRVIIDYLSKNKEKLINYYNDVVEHKIVDKIVKEILK